MLLASVLPLLWGGWIPPLNVLCLFMPSNAPPLKLERSAFPCAWNNEILRRIITQKAFFLYNKILHIAYLSKNYFV